MRKIYGLLLIAAITFIGCQDNEEVTFDAQSVDMSDFYVHTDDDNSRTAGANQCHTMTVLNRQLQENPGLYKKMYDVEYATRKFLKNNAKGNSSTLLTSSKSGTKFSSS